MTEPHRLLPRAGDDLTRQLLEAGRSASDAPSEALRAKMWSGIEASLAPLAGGAAAAGAASQGSAAAGGGTLTGAAATGAAPGAVAASAPGVGLAIGTKIGIVGLLVGATLVTATVVRPPRETTTPPAVVVEQTQSSQSGATAGQLAAGVSQDETEASAPSEPSRDEPVSPPAAAELKPDSVTPKASARPSSQPAGPSATKTTASSLVEEVAAVQKARAALAQGNATEALAVLAELDRTVPRGSLGQERVVLAIEALAASGQRGKAGQLAKAFLAANPSSPYADRVRPYAL